MEIGGVRGWQAFYFLSKQNSNFLTTLIQISESQSKIHPIAWRIHVSLFGSILSIPSIIQSFECPALYGSPYVHFLFMNIKTVAAKNRQLKDQAQSGKKGNGKENQHNHRCNFIEQQFKNIGQGQGIPNGQRWWQWEGKMGCPRESHGECVVSALLADSGKRR